ncbi:MAG: hypothetical protein DMG09_26645 [Acidobacteria bacterium]|nr:MAG: hypothetical protein DMG09_26645 [Acidobacteriota bacterium]
MRARPDVDPRRVAVGGHSFGGQLTLLLAEHDPNVGAIVVFGPGGGKLGRLATVAGAVTRRCRRRERARVFHPRRQRLLECAGNGPGRRHETFREAAPAEDLPACRPMKVTLHSSACVHVGPGRLRVPRGADAAVSTERLFFR